MKKKIKFFSVGLSILISFATAYSISIPASAITSYRSIDNDSIATGYGNFIAPPTATYIYLQDTGLYNNDARYTSSSYYNYRYHWTYPSITASGNSCYFKIGAYLNHYTFNDTAAYYAEYRDTMDSLIGYIDQDNAASGWNYTVKQYVHHNLALDGFYSHQIAILPSGTFGYRTGADAACVYFYT